jgi:hypothetical protein
MPTVNKIQKELYSSNSPATKIANIWNLLNALVTTPGRIRIDFFAIVVYKSGGVSDQWGVVGDFFTCPSTCTCSG